MAQFKKKFTVEQIFSWFWRVQFFMSSLTTKLRNKKVNNFREQLRRWLTIASYLYRHQCDQIARLCFQYLAICNYENMPNSISFFTKK